MKLFIPFALMVLLWAAILPFPYLNNTGEFALMADQWAAGNVLYQDVATIRPPALFVAYRIGLAVFGRAYAHVGLELVMQALTLGLVVYAARRWWNDTTAVRAGVVYVVSVFCYAMPDMIAESETFCLPLILICMILAHRAVTAHRPPTARVFIALGLIASLLAVLKVLPAVIPAAIGAWVIWERFYELNWKRALLWMATGLAAGLLPWVIWLSATGALAPMLEMFASWQQPGVSSGRIFFPFKLAIGVLYLIPAGILAVLALLRMRKMAWIPADRMQIFALLGALVAVTIPNKFYLYHFLLALPALTFLGARWWEIVRTTTPRTSLGFKIATFALPLLIVAAPTVRRGEKAVWAATLDGDAYRSKFKVDTLADAQADYRVAARLKAETPVDARLFVWGMTPHINFLAERAPGSRFIAHLPYACTTCAPGLREELLAELAADPPARVVVHWGETNVTDIGDERTANDLLDDFTALRAWLDEHYTLLYRDGPYDVYGPVTGALPTP